jgi:flagellar biosynthesis/type III secretory pathway protein FliH
MNRMWEIKEKGYKSKSELEEAYECGFEDGYEKAMKEFKHASYRDMDSYGEHHSYNERRGRY